MLAAVAYAPASLATYNVTGALAALDTTNLTISFAVPSSQKAVVQFAALMSLSSNGNALSFGLLNHSGGAQIGNTVQAGLGLTAGWQGVITVTWVLTGLSLGTLGLDIAGSTNAGTMAVYAKGATGNAAAANAGPATIVVFQV